MGTDIFLILFGLLVSSIYAQGPIVSTKLGQIRGVVADNGEYTSFLGIPFAKVNEDNPFGDAVPYPEFDSIFEANDDSAICPQEEEFNHTIVGTLDCLHINIHIPNSASPTNLRPVFVWIHGGGFQTGFYGRLLYGPKFLVRHDIVFVTLNYRVGPYGFMCLDIPEVPGNQGLKDQLMALRWIRENIADFGGDPDKITIAGNSAGAAAAEYHLLRQSDGEKLFHQVILQSGSAHVTFMFGSSNSNAPLLMAQHLGLETSNVHEALIFLAKIGPHVIIQCGFDLNLTFLPCIEKIFDGVTSFITEDHRTISDIPIVKDMAIMAGFTAEEAGSYKNNGLGDAGLELFLLHLGASLSPLYPDYHIASENIQHFYFGDEEINDDKIQEFVDFVGDIMFVHPTFLTMQRLIENDGNIFLYKFSYDGERNFLKHKNGLTAGGALHADEIGYLFDISYMDEPNSDDQRVVDLMTTMWTNFIKYANPTPQLSDLLHYKWESISKGTPYYYMDINLELSVGIRPFHERMSYLDLLFDFYDNMHGALIAKSTD